jgi:hypothetical protein
MLYSEEVQQREKTYRPHSFTKPHPKIKHSCKHGNHTQQHVQQRREKPPYGSEIVNVLFGSERGSLREENGGGFGFVRFVFEGYFAGAED